MTGPQVPALPASVRSSLPYRRPTGRPAQRQQGRPVTASDPEHLPDDPITVVEVAGTSAGVADHRGSAQPLRSAARQTQRDVRAGVPSGGRGVPAPRRRRPAANPWRCAAHPSIAGRSWPRRPW